jgi:hypothetical protein
VRNIINGCNKGIEKAWKSYSDLTGGDDLWYAPEYFITSMIAVELGKIKGSKYVYLEYSAKETLNEAGGVGSGRVRQHIRIHGRVDILFCWGKDTPRGIIEVKNRIYNKRQYKQDIERIKSMLKRNSQNSTLQFGIFTFYTSTSTTSKSSAEEKIYQRLETIKKNASSLLDANYLLEMYPAKMHINPENVWCAVSLLIKFKSI